ncbi:MAG: ATP-binding protein, partial [Opitutales bacterium]|nr:ATP-binding protein [Opitutales bacterium]
MKSQFKEVVREKILQGVEKPSVGLTLTRREASPPLLKGKAVTVIGMRRSGKTCYLQQLRGDRLKEGIRRESMVYFNFEDERLAGFTAQDLNLIPSLHQRLFPDPTDGRRSYFLDEIQLVPEWEQFVRRLLDEGECDIFLSGPSARLLSREVATAMRGRGWEVVITPFSFPEYLRHHNREPEQKPKFLQSREKMRLDTEFQNFLVTGGFPEAQGLPDSDRRQLLQSYVDVVLLRDIIERHKVSNATALRWMTRRLLANPAGLFSVTKFEAELKSQGIGVGRETLYQFLAYLEDAFLLQIVPIATDSEKRRQVNPRKVYPLDPALGPVFDRSQKQNLGYALEVAVHNELFRRRAEAAYVKTKEGYEVDFLVRNTDGSHGLIQVAADIDDAQTRKRECRALQAAAGEIRVDRQLLLTAESRLPSPAVPSPIEVLPAWEW